MEVNCRRNSEQGRGCQIVNWQLSLDIYQDVKFWIDNYL